MKTAEKVKITALIPGDLIAKVRRYTHQATTTESLIKALQEWVAIKKISEISESIRKRPLKFQKNFDKNLIRRLRNA